MTLFCLLLSLLFFGLRSENPPSQMHLFKKGDVSPAEWGAMKARVESGWSISAVARRMGRTRATVRKCLAAREAPGRRLRRSSGKTLARRRLIKELLGKKRVVNGRSLPKYCGSAAAMAAGLRKEHGLVVSRSTVAKDLAAVADNFVRPRTPFEGRASLEARRLFKRHCRNVPIRRIVFSDEHWITTNDHTSRTMWLRKGMVRSKRSKELIPVVRKARYNIPSFMIWGAVGVGFKSQLIFIDRKKDEEGKVKALTSPRYVKTCLSTISNGQLPPGAIFMQDGARCHTAKSTLSYLERKGVPVLDHWPAYSPDLNPIENLWAYLDALIAERAPRTDAELKKVAISVWSSIPQSVVDNYVLSFSGKLRRNIE